MKLNFFGKLGALFSFKAPVTAMELQSYVVSSLSTLRALVYLLMIVIFILAVSVLFISDRKPIVIRIDELGHVDTVKNYAFNHNVTEVEINAFSKEFLQYIVEINSLTIAKDLSHALNMMTSQFQESHMKQLKNSRYIQKIRKTGIKREFEIDKMKITAQTDEGYELDIRGILSTKPLHDMNATAEQAGLMGQLYLIKVPRREHSPRGLLVSNFRWREVPLDVIYAKEKNLPLKEQK